MKKFFFVVILITGIVIVGAAMGEGNVSADQKGSLLPALAQLFEAAQHLFSLIADVTIRVVNDLYATVPEPLHCLFGLVFQAGALLALLGVWTLFSGVRFWEKHF